MKKLVIIIATLVIALPLVFKDELFNLAKISEKTANFFASSSDDLARSGQAEFNRVLDQALQGDLSSGINSLVKDGLVAVEPIDSVVPVIDENEDNEDKESNYDYKEEKEMKVGKETETSLIISVPFSSQAPLGDWADPRQQDACEEVSVIMAMAWIKDRRELDPLVTQNEITALADWQQEKYAEHRDLHIDEVRTRLFAEYYDYHQVETRELKNKEEIITALKNGKIILVPTNGQLLNNPHFTPPGPERHLLVIIGYDSETDEFITNDPGTRHGASYRYQTDHLFQAISTYPTGFHEPIINPQKTGLFVSK